MDSIDENAHEDEWDRAFNMNVKSHFWLMHAAKKYLDETEGAFILTASLAGVIPSGSSLVGIDNVVIKPDIVITNKLGLLRHQSGSDPPHESVSGDGST